MVNKNIIDDIDLLVGSEKKLKDILQDDEVMSLLEDTIHAGASTALIKDDRGNTLWISGEEHDYSHNMNYPISFDDEIVGYVIINGDNQVEGLSRIACNALNLLVQTNLKRMLTSEVHLLVLNQSNEELLEVNKQLAASEKKYRELSEHLEEKVKERTSELRQVQLRLLQQEKLASIGQLAAGIAHEINNPMGFVTSNLNTLKTYMSRCREVLQLCRSAMLGNRIHQEFENIFSENWQRLKLDDVFSDVDALIHESLEGVARVKCVVSNLRGVSHIDEATSGMIDINEELDMILNLLNNEIPHGSTIVKRFGILPRLICDPGLIAQAFLNIILNALQARTEALEVDIKTMSQSDQVVIRVVDNGPGIPDEIINKVFDPFFTTREVGSGMGLGLTLAYDIIVSHGGTIEVQGRNGTTVEVRLPVRK
jgi:two-component system, NtrC family, sensor kinase